MNWHRHPQVGHAGGRLACGVRIAWPLRRIANPVGSPTRVRISHVAPNHSLVKAADGHAIPQIVALNQKKISSISSANSLAVRRLETLFAKAAIRRLAKRFLLMTIGMAIMLMTIRTMAKIAAC